MKRTDLEQIIAGAAPAIKRYVAKTIEPLQRRLIEMEARLKETGYRGIWRAKTAYARGSFVSHQGSMWHSNEDENADKPGSSDAWVLCVKRGRDGKDAT